jgi:hypothetical protein
MGSGCGSNDRIVVYWTVDTLGTHAARVTDWCGFLRGVAGEHGLDAACLEGAVSPSSWTAEAHTRILWPEHRVGSHRARLSPACDAVSVFSALVDERGGRWLFGSDNPLFGFDAAGVATCGDSRSWTAGSHAWWVAPGPIQASVQIPAEERAVEAAIDAVLEQAGRHRPLAVYLNDIEAGGHSPHCWYDPTSPACEAWWQIGVEAGLVAADDDRVAAWLDASFERDIVAAAKDATDPLVLRDMAFALTVDGIAHFRAERFAPRLERLLAGLEERDRLDDLVLVIAGDHGENPCISLSFGTDVQCSHGGRTTEWTGLVPVFVLPGDVASRWEAAGLTGDAQRPWSLSNVSWGLLAEGETAPPPAWPSPEPPGTATSWSCKDDAGGVRVVGDVSLRCALEQCAAWTWGEPDDPQDDPTPLAAIPPELADFAPEGQPNWFATVCVAPE